MFVLYFMDLEREGSSKKEGSILVYDADGLIHNTDAVYDRSELERVVTARFNEKINGFINEIRNDATNRDKIMLMYADQDNSKIFNSELEDGEVLNHAILDIKLDSKYESRFPKSEQIHISAYTKVVSDFTTAQILSPNEVRAIVRLEPVDDPKADELRHGHL